ncbi:MAG: nucleoside deaminase [Bacteroidia bacterium]|nr:nucleoside deaminase [Bacteroidia bacterium]
MNEKQIKFMREAIRLSVESVKNGGGPFGAIVVKGEEILAWGNNRVTQTFDPTAHAEVVAIREACKQLHSFQLEDCEIYTSCEPCPMCLGAIYWARPSKVFYGNNQTDAALIGFDDSFIYREISISLSERKIPMTQLLPEEAIRAFQLWEIKADKTKY